MALPREDQVVQPLEEPKGVEQEVLGRRNQWVKSENQAREQVFEDPVVLSALHCSSSYTECPRQFILPI